MNRTGPRKRPEKKSESLEIRVAHSEKQAFLAACRRRGETASDVLRGFMRRYARSAPSGIAKSPDRMEFKMSYFAAAALAAVFAFDSATMTSTAQAGTQEVEQAFAEFDLNGDAVLDRSEFYRIAGFDLEAWPDPALVSDIERAIDEADPPADGQVDRRAVINDALAEAEAELEAEFARMDGDGDGFVRLAEFTAYADIGD